jgi:hypothetical protein
MLFKSADYKWHRNEALCFFGAVFDPGHSLEDRIVLLDRSIQHVEIACRKYVVHVIDKNKI